MSLLALLSTAPASTLRLTRKPASKKRNGTAEPRIVVFGHSHIPWLEDVDGLMLLNPGSAMDRRRQPHCTIAILTISDGAPSAKIIPV